MKVQIINARLNGKDLESGEVYDIEDKLALRWIEKGHAQVPKAKVSDSGSEGDDLSRMSKKKLLSLAKEMGMDMADLKNASKEEIIRLIEISKRGETDEDNSSREGNGVDEKEEEDKGNDQTGDSDKGTT